MAIAQPAAGDWDMSDWDPAEIVVEGVVMALEGCGDNDAEVEVVDITGQALRIMCVQRAGERVRIVVSEARPADARPDRGRPQLAGPGAGRRAEP